MTFLPEDDKRTVTFWDDDLRDRNRKRTVTFLPEGDKRTVTFWGSTDPRNDKRTVTNDKRTVTDDKRTVTFYDR